MFLMYTEEALIRVILCMHFGEIDPKTENIILNKSQLNANDDYPLASKMKKYKTTIVFFTLGILGSCNNGESNMVLSFRIKRHYIIIKLYSWY